MSWAWEFDEDFDKAIARGQYVTNTTQWVDSKGNPITVGSEMTAHDVF